MPTDADQPLKTLLAAIAAMVAWFKSASVRGVIIGGVANAFLGRTRATRDVDGLVILETASEIGPFVKKAAAHGIKPRIADAVEFASIHRVLLLRHSPSQIDIDVSCGSLPFESEVVDRAIADKTLGFDVPLPTPEDLIVMKAVANRPHDWRDIEGVIDAHPHLDVAQILHWSRRFAEILDASEIVEQLKHRLQNAGLIPEAHRARPCAVAVKTDNSRMRRKAATNKKTVKKVATKRKATRKKKGTEF